jgi:hypothetical protein
MRIAVAGAIVLLCASAAWAQRADGVVDLSGERINIFAPSPHHHGPPVRLTTNILIFATTDCPISSRYAPEIKRLADKYTVPSITNVWLVFPVPTDIKDPDRIRRHLAQFDYGARPLLDTRQSLVKLTGVTVTPEAAVIDPKGQVVYRGRIDDRYIALGNERLVPTTRDLEDVMKLAALANPVTPRRTTPVGCYLSDLLK